MITLIKSRRRAQNERLAEELRQLSELIDDSDRVFNEVDDENLIEAAIYDRSALLARYAYVRKILEKSSEKD